jgi:hypothetical protein
MSPASLGSRFEPAPAKKPRAPTGAPEQDEEHDHDHEHEEEDDGAPQPTGNE